MRFPKIYINFAGRPLWNSQDWQIADSAVSNKSNQRSKNSNKNVDSTFNWRQLVALWCVTCNAFIKTIELYFTWAFQKYMTHGVFSKIVCNLIFVTCNMCDMLHVTHVTCKNFIMTIQLYFAWAFQKCMTHRVFSKLV